MEVVCRKPQMGTGRQAAARSQVLDHSYCFTKRIRATALPVSSIINRL